MPECTKAEREWLDAALSNEPLERKNISALRHAVALERLPPEAVELAVNAFAQMKRGNVMLDKAFEAMRAVDFTCEYGDKFYQELQRRGEERAGK